MSLDHLKTHGLEVQTDTSHFHLSGRPCELSAFSFVPTRRDDPPERTAFNTTQKSTDPERVEVKYADSTYDRLFRKDLNYNNKLHRDDREHAKSRGLMVNNEEKVKHVPSLSSSEYGHRHENFVDIQDRQHVRVAIVQSEFYRRTGIDTHA